MKIQQLINCQENILFLQNKLNNETANQTSKNILKNEELIKEDTNNEDVDMDDLPTQFHKNIFLPPMGSPSPTTTEINSTQTQQISFENINCSINENSTSSFLLNNNLKQQQSFPSNYFLNNNINSSVLPSNLAQTLILLQQQNNNNNNNNNQIINSTNFRTITPNLNTNLPTAENFLHFIQLAHTFGFQFNFNQKILNYLPANSINNNSSFDTCIEKQQQQPSHGVKTKRKVGNTSLPTTNANGPQKIESQSEHCSNINSSITNSNESGNTTLLNNEHQKNLISPLLLHFPPIRQLTSEVMRDYLANPGRYECAMWIFHAKVAQKSYGNEKRFFCPPPCIYLFGDGWKNRRKALDQIFKQLKEKNELNCSDFFPNGEYCHEMLSEISVTIGINSPQNNTERLQHIAHSLDFSNGKDYCAAKALFISDTDKRKYFYLQTTFSNVCGINIGTFSSQRIKVISKPSKKKQSMKSSDCKYLCVSNGSKIALFNRLRSQTVSTRYLHVENGCFHASSTKWGAFHINSDNTQPSSSNNSNISQTCTTTIITYGSIIQLVDAQSNIALPSLRIRKVDKQMVLLDPSNQGEPVSQLHKCAFQMVDSSGTVIVGKESLYLCLSHDKIIQHQAVQIDPNRHQISDGAAWTIISTDKSEYRWAEPLSRLGSIARLPITPMPQLHNLNILNNSEINNEIRSEIPENIELNGLNFSPSMRVWLGASPTETIFCSSERLKCSIPSFNSICSDLGFTTESAILANASTTKNEKLDVPIIIVREEDSVVFPTSLSFAYNLDSLSNLTNISRQPLTLTQMNNKKQQQSTSFNENNNNLLLETSSTNKINNFNRFHPYWNNSENGSSDSIVK